jgi:hypothetical protein
MAERRILFIGLGPLAWTKLIRKPGKQEILGWVSGFVVFADCRGASAGIVSRDFAGARDVLAEDSLMTKRALSAVAGFFGLCLPLSAQQTDRPDIFSALNNSLPRLPSLALSDTQRFSFSSAFNWIEPTPPDFLPALQATALPRANASAMPGKDSSKDVVDMQRSNLFDYASGEVGFLYGRSIGKFSREVEQRYIFGEVGNDKFHINAGASYENWSGRFSRFGH